ncbi:uncharacterized protein PpBr36_09443 [Pyricularia pennisetigena]|uniref:uncharacterized protein n=1 Tax=Pyricularia pennisetigena TaxID=1578925 RepID=UPI00114E470C|nr:uncharacterized protein PpBr36_09443 [Pyricularia pennisetigena]TLS21752.1 hypothetical protein PpBr36_09443 [Pyricularia pennisetigena]
MAATCVSCDRVFVSEESLQQHLRDSPVHASMYKCQKCDRSFSSDEALQQHLRDSPVHASMYECKKCDRYFSSDEALQQHVRDSPAHAPSFDCETCDRAFKTDEALQQHLKYADAHQQQSQPQLTTPLDEFFLSFEGFEYIPSQPPAKSFARLEKHQGWQRGAAAAKKAWNKYQDALDSELQMWYGPSDDLTAWHALCRAVGINPLPQSCGQCKKAVHKKHVNIVDLVDWSRNRGRSEKPVQTFRSVAQLQDYTIATGKIYSKRQAKAGSQGKKTVLKHLLRQIF